MSEQNIKLPSLKSSEDLPEFIAPIHGVKGTFTLSENSTVPYFFALIRLDKLVTDLKTYDQTAASLTTKWKLGELYQRQINEKRVNDEIVNGYLKLPNKLKFFNSLVVTLLPKDKEGRVCESFEDYLVEDDLQINENNKDIREWIEKNGSRVIFGGVQITTTALWGVSVLSWDKKRVDAVAVDGQHRLRALRKYFTEVRREALSPEEEKAGIPVIFLLLSEKVGYKQSGVAQSIKNVAREIFTDLNKNAKKVDQATEIILDDRSIEARCVRSLLTESTNEDDPLKLPLSLIRWQDHNIKFDKGYFIASLVGLHAIVDYLLDISPPTQGDTTDKDQIENFVKRLDEAFGSGSPRALRNENGLLLREHVETRYFEGDEVQIPLASLPMEFLESAQKAFETNWRPTIVKLIRGHTPYKNILDYASGERLYSDVFFQFEAQPRTHQRELKNQLTDKNPSWEKEQIEKHALALENFKVHPHYGERWAFKNLFQKAYLGVSDKILNLPFSEAIHDNYQNIPWLIKLFNGLEALELLCVGSRLTDGVSPEGNDPEDPEDPEGLLWAGISVHPSTRKILVTKKSCEQMQNVFLLWFYANVHQSTAQSQAGTHPENQSLISDRSLFDAVTTNSALYPNGQKAAEELVKSFKQDQNARALFSRAAGKEDKISKAAKDRVVKIIAAGLIA